MTNPEIVLTLPDGSERRVPAGTTPLEVAASIGPRLASDAVGAELDGEQDRPAPAARARRAVPDLHGQEPGGRRVRASLGRAPARRRRAPPVARGRVRRRPPGPLREVPVRLPLPARLHPRGPRGDRGEDEGDRRRGRALRARRGVARRGRADLPRHGLHAEARAPEGHPGGRDDHPLPARRLHRSLPRAARPARRADRRGQAARGLGRPTSRATSGTSGCSGSTAPPSSRRRSSPTTSSASSRRARATTAGSGPSSTCSASTRWRPASPFFHPKGAAVYNGLIDYVRELNAQERLRRGGDAADPRRRALAHLRATGRTTARTCSSPSSTSASTRSSR